MYRTSSAGREGLWDTERGCTPELPYIEAGLTHVLMGNYASLTTSGDWGDAGDEDANLATVNLLRDALGQAIPGQD